MQFLNHGKNKRIYFNVLATASVVLSACIVLSGVAQAAPRPPKNVTGSVTAVENSALAEVAYFANSVIASQDNAGLSFFVVDKKSAQLYAYDESGQLQDSSPVLIGAAVGDLSVPGIGLRPMEKILPVERTTPAGRFIAERGRNTSGEEIVWVDYEAAVSMHRVRANNPAERRLGRLATATPDDNRISYGCINVPVAFYEAHVRPVFAAKRAVVYVLPEVKSTQEVFAFIRAVERAPEQTH
jgi:hypothetical protein